MGASTEIVHARTVSYQMALLGRRRPPLAIEEFATEHMGLRPVG